MALATMLGRARILQIAAISRHQKLTPNFSRFSRIQQLSIAADENLIRVVETPEVPVRFPFEIEDEPLSRKVIFQRKYGNEVVRIEADNMARTADIDKDDIDEDDIDTIGSFPAMATVTKHAYGQLLSFEINVFHDEFSIDSANLRYTESPDGLFFPHGLSYKCWCKGTSVVYAFFDYLGARGIENGSTSLRFLFDYIDYTNKRDSLILADKVKNFVLN